jgi:CheY-like chemotaxis protein
MSGVTNHVSSPACILVADDDDTFREVTVEFLRGAGYVCDCAGDAQGAVRALSERPYDLLITDIQMPGNTDLELLRELQRSRITVPVILVTGYPTVPTAVEALRLSVVDYLIKPLDFPAVLDRIVLAIDKGRLLRSLHRARQEATEWAGAIERYEQALVAGVWSVGGAPAPAASPDQYLGQMAAQLLKLVLHFNAVMGLTSNRQPDQAVDLCATLRCPRRAAYGEALNEAVEVLEKTKHAFRSKDLGMLRKRLEGILKADR